MRAGSKPSSVTLIRIASPGAPSPDFEHPIDVIASATASSEQIVFDIVPSLHSLLRSYPKPRERATLVLPAEPARAARRISPQRCSLSLRISATLARHAARPRNEARALRGRRA